MSHDLQNTQGEKSRADNVTDEKNESPESQAEVGRNPAFLTPSLVLFALWDIRTHVLGRCPLSPQLADHPPGSPFHL